jgi:hypothetical protein
MKWYRYFSTWMIIFFTVFIIIYYNENISSKNRKIQTINKGITDVKKTMAKLEELDSVEDFIPNGVAKEKLDEILYNIEYNNNLKNLVPQFFNKNIFDSNVKNYIAQSDSSILFYTYLLLDNLENQKVNLINEIRRDKGIRDFLFIFLIFLIFVLLYLKLYKLINRTKKFLFI